MSFCRKTLSKATQNHVVEIHETIEHARLAQESFFSSIANRNADISAPTSNTNDERYVKLIFSQTRFKNGFTKMEIELRSNHWDNHEALSKLTEAITKLFALSFGKHFATVDAGTVHKVCGNDNASYSTWIFSKNYVANDILRLPPKAWLLPENTTSLDNLMTLSNPLRSLPTPRTLPPDLRFRVDIVDTNYFIMTNGEIDAPRAEYMLFEKQSE